ncbi:putative histidine kinase/HSP90-like ATPase superfamily, morc, S5 domain 2 [Helianthus annuus]|uniref:Histidine kinase/HSP90-like ATPase n=1 Tax=Helianthus annuus TaxID=4232 RepID=A0A251TN74_HELAN|nr:protein MICRORCHIDIA 7 [Helianthus annuus]KAF5808567.1 putative histidine kinase/HSP90-like ATPase [Helianthus annuus]KAJ0579710.1 putative histidine kinase/HSP90-like ATPase superfamily, morc, S5 domain 2 [Helianthus annuus]KAJ0587002.1 putative histidine kinase/HSP90-like ATPase superfamily, morc, S5 domain 2 [Helianthus annuus]KAJ0595607.1 putative histidine kinase/HSP90-like ATPase superfamily, morc, S5 domain 2 [Helianthus annuus]KAJ0756258.1 putative histidine kinase/HSP90-like ATPase
MNKEPEIKQEDEPFTTTTTSNKTKTKHNGLDIPVIFLDGSEEEDDDSTDEDDDNGGGSVKRSRVLSGGDDDVDKNNNKKKKGGGGDGVRLPSGFLEPLPGKKKVTFDRSCKQFWKSGDFEGRSSRDWSVSSSSGGLDHLRVHPRFLHSNATSHKWVLGAFAELLDNSLDENCNGATYVKIDMLKNKKDNSRMLLIEDNGGGMDPDKMRHCMSLGYSLKSKVKDMIGQYGNGFKTSTMRLGADVIVFSRCSGEDGKTSTQSIGLLSYTFLRSTGKEDTVVPMVDYEKSGKEWNRMKRSSAGDWDTNVETIVQWSPFSSEADLLKQFGHMKDQGTLIIIYNLWEDDQGNLELDFDADKHDIQIRGVNRDEKNIEMAEQHPNSRHYLTYRHSLRSYASILYLRVPHNFRMILRGKDVEHHNIVNDMMMTNVIKYRPQPGVEGLPKDSNIVAVVTVGFVKDAAAHIDVQGFNVYHKNRLIKPFWRLWNAAGSDGRGVIGVLEANFVEPAHDKQGFERTTVLQRLETRLVQMQKSYWSTYCHKIGYAPRRHGKSSEGREPSPDYEPGPSVRKSQRTRPAPPLNNKASTQKPHKEAVTTKPNRHPTAATNGNINIGEKGDKSNKVSGVGASSTESTSPLTENENTRDELQTMVNKQLANGRKTRLLSNSEVRNLGISPTVKAVPAVDPPHTASPGANGNETVPTNSSNPSLERLTEENRDLKKRLTRSEEEILGDLMQDLKSEKNRCKELEAQLEEEKQKYDVLKKEQDSMIAIFSEEKEHSAAEVETLKKKLKEAESTNKDLMEKVAQLQLEKMKRMRHK